MRLKKISIFFLAGLFLFNTAAYLKSQSKEDIIKARGQIVELTAKKLTVKDEKSNKKITFELGTRIDIEKETSIKLSDIKENTYGRVILDEDSSIVLQEGNTDITYVAKKVILQPEDRKKKSKFEKDKIKGFITHEKGLIRVNADNKTYTFKIAGKFKGVLLVKENLSKNILKKGLTVSVKGKKEGNRIITEEIEIESNE